jgi:phytoene synthase
MRILDDLVDNISNRDNLSINEKKFYLSEIDKWEALITECHSGKEFEDSILLALSDTFKTFDLPISPWVNLAKAMRRDINHSRFNTFEDFLNYAEGASIAPATVFMRILTAQPNGNGYDCRINVTDPYMYAKDLAIFCYLTHILRDISCDLELGERGLIYLPIEDLNRLSISENDLWNFKRTKSINANFQQLMEYQIKRARKFEKKGKAIISELVEFIDSDCLFILNLLVSLYEETMEKIESVAYNVFNGKHELNSAEIFKTTVNNARIHSIGSLKVLRFGFELAKKNSLKFLYQQS